MCATALRPCAFRLYPPSNTETMRYSAWVRATVNTCSVVNDRNMLKLCVGLGFRIEPHPENEAIKRVVQGL